MGKSRKDYEKFLNSISPDRDDETWIIGGKNRYCGRENYGTMIKRYDPIGFNVGYREWAEQPENCGGLCRQCTGAPSLGTVWWRTSPATSGV